MTKNTLTIALNGEVSLEDFATAAECLKKIVTGLSREVASNATICWTVVGLDSGSAIATLRGTAPAKFDDELPVASVITAYEKMGRALQKRSRFPYPSVEKSARKLVGLIDGHISSIRFETEDFDAEVFGEGDVVPEEPVFPTRAYGSIRGRIQSLSNRGNLRFTLYDLVDDQAISCYLSPGMEDLMRTAWGKVADVEGVIRRHPRTGQPTTVRHIEAVTIVPEDRPGDWRAAIACAPVRPGAESPEITLRRFRDAE